MKPYVLCSGRLGKILSTDCTIRAIDALLVYSHVWDSSSFSACVPLASAICPTVVPIPVVFVKSPGCTGIPKETPPESMEYFVSDMDTRSIPSVPFPLPE